MRKVKFMKNNLKIKSALKWSGFIILSLFISRCYSLSDNIRFLIEYGDFFKDKEVQSYILENLANLDICIFIISIVLLGLYIRFILYKREI